MDRHVPIPGAQATPSMAATRADRKPPGRVGASYPSGSAPHPPSPNEFATTRFQFAHAKARLKTCQTICSLSLRTAATAKFRRFRSVPIRALRRRITIPAAAASSPASPKPYIAGCQPVRSTLGPRPANAPCGQRVSPHALPGPAHSLRPKMSNNPAPSALSAKFPANFADEPEYADRARQEGVLAHYYAR